jgi:hypothetical protein
MDMLPYQINYLQQHNMYMFFQELLIPHYFLLGNIHYLDFIFHYRVF